MLRHLGEKRTADRLEKAIAAVIAEGKDVTYDFKPAPPRKSSGHLSGCRCCDTETASGIIQILHSFPFDNTSIIIS